MTESASAFKISTLKEDRIAFNLKPGFSELAPPYVKSTAADTVHRKRCAKWDIMVDNTVVRRCKLTLD